MRSRREQIRAYRFVTRRIVSALLGNEPDGVDVPLRRAGLTTFASVMVGAVALAGFGVYGLVRPGGDTSWRQAGALIVEKDTGTRFVYRAGRLHPVLNYASARLVLGAPQVTVVTVAAASLAGVPRGRPVGIPDAPDALPTVDRLAASPWSVCATRDPHTAGHEPIVTVLVGTRYRGADALADRGLLVSTDDTGTYLVWHGHRLRVPSRTGLSSLGWASHPTLRVAPAFLDALPAGPDVAAPDVPHAGEHGPRIAGRPGTVGAVYRVTAPNGTDQYTVLLADGLAPVSPVTADLLLGSAGRTAPARLSPTGFDRAPRSDTRLEPAGALDRRPQLATVPDEAGPAVCAAYRRGGDSVEVYREAPEPVTDRDPAGPVGGTAPGAPTATAVVVPGGGGALVRAVPAPGVSSGAMFLITDQGVRYGVPGARARAALGYGDVTPVPVPAELVELVPAGPALDPTAADRYTTPGSSAPVPSR
ncbi:MAG: type VII secretion protein EccB [Actinocatenispora sp.]